MRPSNQSTYRSACFDDDKSNIDAFSQLRTKTSAMKLPKMHTQLISNFKCHLTPSENTLMLKNLVQLIYQFFYTRAYRKLHFCSVDNMKEASESNERIAQCHYFYPFSEIQSKNFQETCLVDLQLIKIKISCKNFLNVQNHPSLPL